MDDEFVFNERGERVMESVYSEIDVDTLRDKLIGRSVTAVQLGGDMPSVDRGWRHPQGKVTLDDGTVLLLGGNDGGCSCGAGDYELVRLNDMPINGITNVEVDVEDTNEYDGHTYRIFVLAQDQRFELAAFDGDDGNGYYGTGFWFTVTRSDWSAITCPQLQGGA